MTHRIETAASGEGVKRPISVTQADREAAANLSDFLHSGQTPKGVARMREGSLDSTAFVQAFARHRLSATVEVRKELIAQGCIHATKAGERGEERADIKAWQESQREFFNRTICEIVSEYAEWRDAQEGIA